MSVKVVVRKSTETVEHVTDELVHQIPGSSVLKISDLSRDTHNQHCWISGKIQSLWDVQKIRNNTHRKLVLQDGDGNSINVYLYGEFAEGLDRARRDDSLLLYKFELEESTQHSTSPHKHQVIVQAGQEVPQLWLIAEERVNMNVGTAGPKAKTRKYTYTALSDVRPNTVVDVFGVVKFLKPPKQTRGTDLILIVSLIDSTLHEQDQKLKCVLFMKPDNVPKIEVGNVVRFHRLKIGTHQGELQGGSSPGFSWLVFQGPDAVPQSSTPNYTYSEEDKKKVKDLFEWSNIEDVPITQSTCTLSDIAVNAYFNLVCQVVSTCSIEDGVCFLTRVWDGTKPIYPVRELDTDGDECIVQTNLELLRTASGYLYDICAFDDHFTAASRVKPGMFVKFYNLHAAAYKNSETREDLTALPTVELALHRGTMYGRGFLILDNQSDEVRTLKTKLESILSRNPRPSTSKQTDKENSDAPFSSSTGNDEVHTDGQRDTATSGGIHDSWMESDEDVNMRRTQKTHSADNRNGKCVPVKKCRTDPEPESTEGQGHVTELHLPSDIGSQFSDEPRCMQETATVILNHPHVKRTKISDVLQHSVPFKFRVKVRVLDYHPVPTTATHFVQVYCSKCHFTCKLSDYEEELKETSSSSMNTDGSLRPCPTCEKEMELTYMLRLLLHDGSGWLVANLWRKEADKFFKDIPAGEVLTDPRSFTEVKDYLTLICPRDQNISDKPWVECCVASYTASSGVNYHIFDTVVV